MDTTEACEGGHPAAAAIPADSEWRRLPGLSHYLFSSDGRVWDCSSPLGRLVPGTQGGAGRPRLVVLVQDSGLRSKVRVDVCISRAFGLDPPDAHAHAHAHATLEHLDGDPANCALSNLRWTSVGDSAASASSTVAASAGAGAAAAAAAAATPIASVSSSAVTVPQPAPQPSTPASDSTETVETQHQQQQQQQQARPSKRPRLEAHPPPAAAAAAASVAASSAAAAAAAGVSTAAVPAAASVAASSSDGQPDDSDTDDADDDDHMHDSIHDGAAEHESLADWGVSQSPDDVGAGAGGAYPAGVSPLPVLATLAAPSISHSTGVRKPHGQRKLMGRMTSAWVEGSKMCSASSFVEEGVAAMEHMGFRRATSGFETRINDAMGRFKGAHLGPHAANLCRWVMLFDLFDQSRLQQALLEFARLGPDPVSALPRGTHPWRAIDPSRLMRGRTFYACLCGRIRPTPFRFFLKHFATAHAVTDRGDMWVAPGTKTAAASASLATLFPLPAATDVASAAAAAAAAQSVVAASTAAAESGASAAAAVTPAVVASVVPAAATAVVMAGSVPVVVTAVGEPAAPTAAAAATTPLTTAAPVALPALPPPVSPHPVAAPASSASSAADSCSSTSDEDSPPPPLRRLTTAAQPAERRPLSQTAPLPSTTGHPSPSASSSSVAVVAAPMPKVELDAQCEHHVRNGVRLLRAAMLAANRMRNDDHFRAQLKLALMSAP